MVKLVLITLPECKINPRECNLVKKFEIMFCDFSHRFDTKSRQNSVTLPNIQLLRPKLEKKESSREYTWSFLCNDKQYLSLIVLYLWEMQIWPISSNIVIFFLLFQQCKVFKTQVLFPRLKMNACDLIRLCIS